MTRSHPSSVANRWAVPLLGAMALTVGACSFSFGAADPASSAERLIDDELAVEFALTGVDTTCTDPVDTEPGSAFSCVSSSDQGEIRWAAVIEDEDTFSVEAENLISDGYIEGLERSAVDSIEQQSGRTLGYENFDCGDGPIGLPADGILDCELTDPDNGDIYDAVVEVTDIDQARFNFEVADQPRG